MVGNSAARVKKPPLIRDERHPPSAKVVGDVEVALADVLDQQPDLARRLAGKG